MRPVAMLDNLMEPSSAHVSTVVQSEWMADAVMPAGPDGRASRGEPQPSKGSGRWRR
jgi:hypothetical protein